jgi:hypothetical protein
MKATSASLLLSCLFGCSSAPVTIAPPDASTVPTLTLAEFPGATTGFDDRRDDDAWDGSDQVVFALRLRKGAEVHRWLLTLDVILGENLIAMVDGGKQRISLWQDKTWTYEWTENGKATEQSVTSKMLPVGVTVHDEAGRKLSNSVVKLPSRLLGRGLLPAIETSFEIAARQGQAPTEADGRPLIEAMLGMMSLLNVVQEDDALADYFWQVVEKPSVWSLITGLGARASMSMPFEQSLPATRLPANLPPTEPAYVVPVRIDVNGSPALLADVVAVDARRPYALCGGMVAAVARHPSNPDITFELQLIAAHCGK